MLHVGDYKSTCSDVQVDMGQQTCPVPTFSLSVGVPKWTVRVTSVVPSRYWAPESHRYSSDLLRERSVAGVGLRERRERREGERMVHHEEEGRGHGGGDRQAGADQ